MKNIVITGASLGIGRATALELTKDPDNQVFLISRDTTRLDTLLEEIRKQNPGSHAYGFDLVSGEYGSLVNEIKTHLGKIDVLINNAGALVNKPFEEISLADFNKVFDTNFKSPFFLIQQLLPLFNEGAHVVNISSMGGFQGSVKFPGLSIYSASKGALATLTECLAVELAPLKVNMNCLSLGSVQTSMFEQAFPGYTAQVGSESIASWIAYFALNGHKWMNGKILPVSLTTP